MGLEWIYVPIYQSSPYEMDLLVSPEEELLLKEHLSMTILVACYRTRSFISWFITIYKTDHGP